MGCEQAFLANGKTEDSDETDSEDDMAYINNVEHSAFLVNKLKDSKISSPQKTINKSKKSSKSDDKEDKEKEVNQQNNIKMSKLKKYLEEIASQNKMRKTEKSCREAELCNYTSNNSKYEYTDFVAFIQCGLSKENDDQIYNSSDSGSDTKGEDTSFDSNSEAEFGDNEEVSSSSEDEDGSVLPPSSTTQTTNEPNENVNSSFKSTAQNSDLKLAKPSEKSSGSESECIFQSEESDSDLEERTTSVTTLTTESDSSELSEEDEHVIEINDANFLATSVANYRRRQLQGLMEVNMPEEIGIPLGKGEE